MRHRISRITGSERTPGVTTGDVFLGWHGILGSLCHSGGEEAPGMGAGGLDSD